MMTNEPAAAATGEPSRAHRVSTRRGVGALIAMSLAISGCAINPYIANTRPPRTELSRSSPDVTASTVRALAYADATFDAYDAKLWEEFNRQQVLSGTLLTIGAATLGLAAGHAHRDAFVTAAVGGGLIYQLGTWNSSKDRLGIYVEGMKALACSKTAVSPLLLGSDAITTIKNQEERTRDTAIRMSRASGHVVQWLAIVGGSGSGSGASQLEKAAQDELVQQGATLKEASDALARASGLRHRVEGAGAQLDAQVDQIRRAVSMAHSGTLADLSQLRTAVQSLSDYANIFGEGLDLRGAVATEVAAANKSISKDDVTQQNWLDDTAKAVDSGKTVNPAVALAAALGRLRAERQALSTDVSILNGTLAETTSLAQLKTDLNGCGVDLAKAKSTLRLTRKSVSFEVGTAGTALVSISGGTLPYSVALVDLPAKGINVSAPAGGAIVVVTASTDTEVGKSYLVSVTDAAGLTASITVKVTAKAADTKNGETKSTTKATTSTTAKASCEGQQSRTPEEICLLQEAVKVPVTGKFDAKTCTAFKTAPLTKQYLGLVNTVSMNAVEADMKLSPGATSESIRAKLAELGTTSCNGTTLTKATVAAAPVTNGACSPPDAGKTCPIEGARCAFECSMSKPEVAILRQKLGLAQTPEKFDDFLREALGRFQASKKLQNQRGDYTAESAQALAGSTTK